VNFFKAENNAEWDAAEWEAEKSPLSNPIQMIINGYLGVFTQLDLIFSSLKKQLFDLFSHLS